MAATSKPQKFALRILDYFGITKYFNCIGAADMDHPYGKRTGAAAPVHIRFYL